MLIYTVEIYPLWQSTDRQAADCDYSKFTYSVRCKSQLELPDAGFPRDLVVAVKNLLWHNYSDCLLKDKWKLQSSYSSSLWSESFCLWGTKEPKTVRTSLHKLNEISIAIGLMNCGNSLAGSVRSCYNPGATLVF
jgi:hypothetical protein